MQLVATILILKAVVCEELAYEPEDAPLGDFYVTLCNAQRPSYDFLRNFRELILQTAKRIRELKCRGFQSSFDAGHQVCEVDSRRKPDGKLPDGEFVKLLAQRLDPVQLCALETINSEIQWPELNGGRLDPISLQHFRLRSDGRIQGFDSRSNATDQVGLTARSFPKTVK